MLSQIRSNLGWAWSGAAALTVGGKSLHGNVAVPPLSLCRWLITRGCCMSVHPLTVKGLARSSATLKSFTRQQNLPFSAPIKKCSSQIFPSSLADEGNERNYSEASLKVDSAFLSWAPFFFFANSAKQPRAWGFKSKFSTDPPWKKLQI